MNQQCVAIHENGGLCTQIVQRLLCRVGRDVCKRIWSVEAAVIAQQTHTLIVKVGEKESEEREMVARKFKQILITIFLNPFITCILPLQAAQTLMPQHW